MHALAEFDSAQLRKGLPAFKAGDTVRVHCKIKEGDKERVQIFEGVVIARHNAGISSTFTVRKISFGLGVERVFPLHAPFLAKIEVTSVGKVRRSKLYYLKKLSGKKARIAAQDTRGTQREAEAAAIEKAKEEGAEKEKAPEAKAEAKEEKPAPPEAKSEKGEGEAKEEKKG